MQFFLPNIIYDCVENEKWKNIINLHKINYKFNFLEDTDFGIAINTINYMKYFKEYFN